MKSRLLSTVAGLVLVAAAPWAASAAPNDTATILSNGQGNVSQIDQTGGTLKSAYIIQANVADAGTRSGHSTPDISATTAAVNGNSASIVQSGTNSDANPWVSALKYWSSIVQTGNGNFASAVDSGIDNVSKIIQQTNNHAEVTQAGEHNKSVVDQNGNNDAYVTQSTANGVTVANSTNNDSSVTQRHFNNGSTERNLAEVQQVGEDGKSVITQHGGGNYAKLVQEARSSGSGSTITQDNGNRNWASVTQHAGEDLKSTVTQSGDTNTATVNQSDSGNESSVSQSGNQNWAEVTQGGEGNVSSVDQNNGLNQAAVTQGGLENQLWIKQYGGSSATVEQSSNYNTATITQGTGGTSSNLVAYVYQTVGSNNIATVTQIGHNNTATIRQ